MPIGTIVRNIYTRELHIVTSKAKHGYYEVDGAYLMPVYHLDMICK